MLAGLLHAKLQAHSVFAPILTFGGGRTQNIEIIELFAEHNITIRQIGIGTDLLAFLSDDGMLFTSYQGERPRLMSSELISQMSVYQYYIALVARKRILYIANPDKIIQKIRFEENILQIALGSKLLFVLFEKKITIYKLISDDDSNWELNIEYDLSVITSSRIVDMVASQDHALLLDETGKVYSYGISTFGALGRTTKNIWGVVDISEKVKQIAVGRLFSFCLVNSRTIYAFGSNSYNQLGVQTKDIKVMKPTLCDLTGVHGYVVKVHCGGSRTILETTDGFYGIGTSDNCTIFTVGILKSKTWRKLDQPFCLDGSRFSIAMGNTISAVYVTIPSNWKLPILRNHFCDTVFYFCL